MQANAMNLAALDQHWRDIRRDILATGKRRRSYCTALAEHLGINEPYFSIEWKPGDAETAIAVFRDLAQQLARRAHEQLVPAGLHATLDLDEITSEYTQVKRSPLRDHDAYVRACAAKVQTLSLETLWQKFGAAFPKETVEAIACRQVGDLLRDNFKEIRRGEAIKRVGGREVLTQHIYGCLRDPWSLDYSARENLHKAIRALASCLTIANRSDAAHLLLTGGMAFIEQMGRYGQRYASRERRTLSEHLDLVFFKTEVEFRLSSELAETVMVMLARAQTLKEAA